MSQTSNTLYSDDESIYRSHDPVKGISERQNLIEKENNALKVMLNEITQGQLKPQNHYANKPHLRQLQLPHMD